MRIIYPIARGGAGGDVYFERLDSSMREMGLQAKISVYPRSLELAPWLITPFLRSDQTYDIVHSHAELGFPFRKLGKSLVITVHHIVFNPSYREYLSPAQKLYHAFLLFYMKKSLQVADSVVAVSHNTRKEAERVFKREDIKVIHNGIDTSVFTFREVIDPYPGKVKLLFVGNLIRRKGADLLPEIMAKLDDRFVLLYTSGLRSGRLFPDDRMIPLGQLKLPDLVNAYNLCDILLVPSRLEGFGYSVAEAMACGKPVVATNCSSLPELVLDGEGGFLCEMNNADDFAFKIREVAESGQLRREMGEFNRQRAIEEFDLFNMANAYRGLYEEMG